MAKYYSSTFGKISGKHGSAVAVIRKDGTTYLRLHVPASNPRTDKQQAHRAKFALSSKSLVPFNPIFKDTIGITNGISTARSHTFRNAIVGDYPNLSIDYEKIMFSFGPIQKLHNASHTRHDGVVTINWDNKDMYNCHGDDSVSLVVFNKNSKQALHLKDIACRLDEEAMIEVYDSWGDSDLLFWAYAKCGDKISDSVFVNASVESGLDDCSSGDYPLCTTDDNLDKEITHSQNITIDNISSSPNSWANQAIISFIAMLYYLLGLFTQVVDSINIINPVKRLIYRVYEVLRSRCGADSNRAVRVSINSCKDTAYGGLRGKYRSIFPTQLIPIMSYKLQI